MDPERRLKTQRRLAYLWTVILLVACFLPGYWMPVAERTIDSEARKVGIPIDKVVHFFMFGGFAWLWARGERTSIRLLVLGSGIALAGLTEAIQNHPLISRDGDLLDTLADSLGVIAGVVASIPGSRPRSEQGDA